MNNEISRDYDQIRLEAIRDLDDLVEFGNPVEGGTHMQIGEHRDVQTRQVCIPIRQ